MGTTNQILRFDRPLADVICGAAKGPHYDAAEMARRTTEAYEQGQLAQRAFTDKQIAELRTEMQELQRGVLSRLENVESELLQELQNGLPDLVMDLARRLLGGFQPSDEWVEKICRASLDELLPSRDGLELVVGEADAALLEQVRANWQQAYPGLVIRIDTNLERGECLVKSRFGVVDGRHETRLNGLREELFDGRERP